MSAEQQSAGAGLFDNWFAEASKAWADGVTAMGKAAGAFAQASFDDGQNWDGLRSFADLYWDSWERSLGRLLESPDLGHTRELTERFAKAVTAWGEFRRAGGEYQAIMADAWGRAWIRFLKQMGEGERPDSMRELLRAWGQTVDQVLTEVFATEEYAKVQGRLLNATMAYRVAERGVADLFLQSSHVASQTDLNEANRRIAELRREVRELRKLVREGQK